MIAEQSTKIVPVVHPAVIKDNASWTAVELDTNGYEHCMIVVHVGATDIAMVALKMQESAAAGSGQTDITGLVYGTSTGIGGSASTLPSATDDNKIFIFDIDLKARQRYLTLVATAGDGATGTYLSALAILGRSLETPMTATARGAAQVLRV